MRSVFCRTLAILLAGVLFLSSCGVPVQESAQVPPAMPSVPEFSGAERVFAAPFSIRGEADGDTVLAELPENDAVYRSDDPLAGTGTVIAIIDTGFDVSHPAFTLPEGADGKIGREDYVEFVYDTNAAGMYYKKVKDDTRFAEMYISEKIPFAYDYAHDDTDVTSGAGEHGTHVAALAAAGGEAEQTLPGAAPGAQLLLMKVFSDDGETCQESDLCMAVEDAVRLGADVINLSLGAPVSAASDVAMTRLAAAIRAAEKEGVLVICASGNDGASGPSGVKSDAMRADNPDTGLISEPAILPETLSVGASENRIHYVHRLTVGNREIFYDDAYEATLGEIPAISEVLGGQTLSFITVPGVGALSDYEGWDVKGKIALVARGEITFAEKVENAAQNGAAAVIVYSTEPEAAFRMTVGNAPIPSVSVSFEDGTYLAYLGVGEITVSEEGEFSEITLPGAAGFSSWGPSADLTLTPDLTAVGADAVSAVPGGAYDVMSGTSMAAPQISGIAAAYMAEKRALLSSLPGEDRLTHIRAMLMSAAVPLLSEDGLPLSPRVQGAGNLGIDTDVSKMTVTAAGADGAAVISLGNHLPGETGTLAFDVVFTNYGADGVTLRLAADLITEGTEEKNGVWYTTYEPVAVPAMIRFSETEITLAPGGKKTVSVEIVPDAAFLSAHGETAAHGFFLEGYITARDGAGEHIASLPFFGFAGDWNDAPMIDGGDWDGYESYYGGQALFLQGSYAAPRELYPDSRYFAFSPDGDGVADVLWFRLYPLRSIARGQITVYDSAGESVYEGAFAGTTKTFSTAEGIHAAAFALWDGTDGWNDHFFWEDGTYTVHITAYSVSGGVQTMDIPVTLDTKDPALSFSRIGNTVLAEARDTGMLHSLRIYAKNPDFDPADPDSPEYLLEKEINGPMPHLQLRAELPREAEYVYVRAEDCAGNVTVNRCYTDTPSAEKED